MVDAQTITKHALQTLHHLYGKGYFGQQVQHLFLTLQSATDEVDIYFRLSRTRHAVQQRHLLLHHRHQDAVVRFLLGSTQRFDEFRAVPPATIQSANLHLVGFQHLPLHQFVDGHRRHPTGIHQFLLCDLSQWIMILIPP